MTQQCHTPSEQFTFTLENINSAFGISADTLRALAASYGVKEEEIVIRALTIWAKSEIPDLDLDSPVLSESQLKQLAARRELLDSIKNQPLPSLREIFKQLEGDKGANNESAKLVSRDGGDT